MSIRKKKIEEKAKEQAESAENLSDPLLSISKLEFRFDLDRATIRKRLAEAGLEPDSEKSNEKLYRLSRVAPFLEANEEDKKLEAVKRRKLEAEASLKELELREATGEMASVAEFTETVQKLFGSLHKKLAVQLPTRISARCHKAKTQAEVGEILRLEISKVFDALRNDFTQFL